MEKFDPSFKVFDPRSEIVGRVMLAALSCINHEETAPVLQELSLTNIEPDTWYPLQTWLDALRMVWEKPNSTLNFVSLGMQATMTIPFPPVFDTLPFAEVLKSVPQGYDMDHRGGDYGSVKAELVNERRLQYILRTPYPDDYFYGATYGLAKRFVPADIEFVVAYADDIPRRDQGGESTIITVAWKSKVNGSGD